MQVRSDHSLDSQFSAFLVAVAFVLLLGAVACGFEEPRVVVVVVWVGRSEESSWVGV